jgi:hypothetical protein
MLSRIVAPNIELSYWTTAGKSLLHGQGHVLSVFENGRQLQGGYFRILLVCHWIVCIGPEYTRACLELCSAGMTGSKCKGDQ